MPGWCRLGCLGCSSPRPRRRADAGGEADADAADARDARADADGMGDKMDAAQLCVVVTAANEAQAEAARYELASRTALREGTVCM